MSATLPKPVTGLSAARQCAHDLLISKTRKNIADLVDQPTTWSFDPKGEYGNWKEGFFEIGSWTTYGVIVPQDLTLVPLHRIYEEQYAVYFHWLTPEEWALCDTGLREEMEQKKRREAATLDSVTPGFQQPEVEHGLRSENSDVGDFLDRKWREGQDGGWFSYEIKTDPANPVVLVANHWRGEWEVRDFDILVDGEKIATQRLRTNRPGDFYDEIYPVPFHLTEGKTSVRVRFQAHPGSTAGRLFGLRVMLP